MEKSGAASYVYAKACGMLSKAFVSKNANQLFNAKSLSELWSIIFTEPVPSMPEVLLATKIEKEAVKKFVKQYTNLLSFYSKPSPFVVEILHRYEITNLKAIAAALSLGEESHPHLVDLGEYRLLNYEFWPDLDKITQNSPYEWYNKVPKVTERQHLDYALDLQGIRTLWNAVNKTKDGSKKVLKDCFVRFYSIKNLLWALRLKVYYKFTKEEIIQNVFYLGDEPSPTDLICSYVYEILDLEIDKFSDWQNWRFSKYLNAHSEGEIWTIDPMVVEQNFHRDEFAKCKKLFHQYPMTDVTLVMFFRIKQQELDCIRAATERIRLNADVKEAMYVAGIED